MALILDHVFVIMTAGAATDAAAALARAGFTGNIQRRHGGQGTANILYCFDNAFLELLWIEDVAQASSPEGQRIGFVDRAHWPTSGALPFGIALRTPDATATLPFPTWRYTPDWGRPIAVARSSDDHHQPFIFQAQRTAPPSHWPGDAAGTRQTTAAFATIRRVTLTLAAGQAPSADLKHLADSGLLALDAPSGRGQMTLQLGYADGRSPATLSLPMCEFVA